MNFGSRRQDAPKILTDRPRAVVGNPIEILLKSHEHIRKPTIPNDA